MEFSNISVRKIDGSVSSALKQSSRLKTGINELFNSPKNLWYTVALLYFISFPFATSESDTFLSTSTTVAVPFTPALLPSFTYMKIILMGGGDEVKDDWSTTVNELKTLDFNLFPETFAGVSLQFEHQLDLASFPTFVEVLELCVFHNISLINVPAYWFLMREQFPEIDSPEIGARVVSLINIQPSVVSMQLPNLEHVEIRQTTRSTPGTDWREQRTDWPSLKSLDISVDAAYSVAWYHYPSTGEDEPRRNAFPLFSTNDLFQFLFEDITRHSLVELKLNFTDNKPFVTVPKVSDIVSACPNLRKLTIVNWPGTNKALTKLWDGLPDLEEVSLENCEDLGDEAFIGQDAKSPVFLKLRELKRFSLKGLNHVPKITDTLFHKVIQHMKLTHFTLTSDKPVKSVTLLGIESLLDGDFAESIQEFSFKNFSLVNVPDEEIQEIEEEFMQTEEKNKLLYHTAEVLLELAKKTDNPHIHHVVNKQKTASKSSEDLDAASHSRIVLD